MRLPTGMGSAMTWRQMAGLLALCLWYSASWLSREFLPSPRAPVAGWGLRLFVAGLGGLAFVALRGGAELPSPRRLLTVSAVSLGSLGVPFLMLTAVEGRVGSALPVLIFALLPVVVMVFQSSTGGAREGLRLMPYGLAGVAGVMVVLPLELPAGWLGPGVVWLAMVSTACCMVWLNRLLKGVATVAAACAIGLGNGLIVLCVGAPGIGRWSARDVGVESLRGLIVDLPVTILLVWLTREITPRRLSSRYLIAPLLTVIEGMAIVRPPFAVRTMAGLLLLGVGAYGVLRAEGGQEGSGLNLGRGVAESGEY